MGKYTTMLDGCTIMNQALAENDYNYYGFVRTGTSGTWVIMREKTDQTEFRYAYGSSDYETNWANRENLSYNIPTNV